MVSLDGDSSNQIDELFDELASWNNVLKNTSMGPKPGLFNANYLMDIFGIPKTAFV